MNAYELQDDVIRLGWSDSRTVYVQYIRDGMATVRTECGILYEIPCAWLKMR